MPTINEELRDLILRRGHYVWSFENGMIRDMVAPFRNAKAEIMTKIADLEDYGQGWTLQYRLDRLNARLYEIDTILKHANDGGIATVSEYLNEFGTAEKEFYEGLLGSRFGTIGIGIDRLPIEQIYEIVNTPIGGAMYHERMVKRYADAMFDVKTNLTQSIMQGEDMGKAARRLFGLGKDLGGTIGNRLMQQSEVIARTEIQRVSNEVSHRIYKENQDVLKGEQFLATLDHKTCIACGNLDGRVFYFGRGGTPDEAVPPIHPSCRCVLVPITKTWEELGVDKKIQEPDAGTRPFTYVGEKPPPGSRQYVAQKNKWAGGVPVAEKYPKWLERMDVQDPDFVRGILGLRRYDLWKGGKVSFSDMARNNRILTLDQLKRKLNG